MVAKQSSSTFSKRLTQALDFAGVPRGRERRLAVAKMFGVTREAVRKWLADESLPDSKRIFEMADRLGVRAEWLLTGSGTMEETPEPLPVKSRMAVKSAAGIRRIWELADEGQLSTEDTDLLLQIAIRLASK